MPDHAVDGEYLSAAQDASVPVVAGPASAAKRAVESRLASPRGNTLSTDVYI